MKRSTAIPDDGELLNLPLEPPQSSDAPDSALDEAFHQESLPFSEPAQTVEPIEEQAAADPVLEERETPSAISPGKRLGAGLLDLGASLAALCVVVVGVWTLGVELQSSAIPAFALFLGSFSFLYHVVPLTFWGQTAGMAAVGLVARTRRDRPLTIQQAVLRWLAAVLTLLGLGLPFLLVWRGRSLADRMSRCDVHLSGRTT